VNGNTYLKMLKIPPYDQFNSLAMPPSQDGTDIRSMLLREITDLYLQKPTHTADEQNQYTELALGLLKDADSETLTIITTRLRDYPAAPSVILRKLDELDALQTRGARTKRESIDDDLTELFFTASPEERQLILTNLDVAARIPTHPLVMAEDTSRHLERAVTQSDPREFSRVLENALSVTRSLAERIVNDDSGEPLVVTAKALGMKAAPLQQTLLALTPSIGKSITRMGILLQLFEEISTEVAVHMISLWQRSEERKAIYEGVHWNDEHRDARSLSSPGPHNIGRERHLQPNRFKAGSR
jgi:hypothetical protein